MPTKIVITPECGSLREPTEAVLIQLYNKATRLLGENIELYMEWNGETRRLEVQRIVKFVPVTAAKKVSKKGSWY